MDSRFCAPCVEAASGPKAHRSGRRERERARGIGGGGSHTRPLAKVACGAGDRAEARAACERGGVSGKKCK